MSGGKASCETAAPTKQAKQKEPTGYPEGSLFITLPRLVV